MEQGGISAVYEFIKRLRAKDSRKRIGMEDRKKIEEVILQIATNGKISCVMCFRVAKNLGISAKELIQIVNEMKIEITESQLGCF